MRSSAIKGLLSNGSLTSQRKLLPTQKFAVTKMYPFHLDIPVFFFTNLQTFNLHFMSFLIIPSNQKAQWKGHNIHRILYLHDIENNQSINTMQVNTMPLTSPWNSLMHLSSGVCALYFFLDFLEWLDILRFSSSDL